MLAARKALVAIQKSGAVSRPLPVRVVARLASSTGVKSESTALSEGNSSPYSQAILAEQQAPAMPELRKRLFNYKADPDTAMKEYVGTGILEYQNGDVYEGEFVNGKKEGQGEIRYTNGATFSGTFKAGRIWTGNGYFQWSNGDSYKGSWANGLMNGRGVLTHALSGKQMKGTFRDGQIYEGTGTRVTPDGKALAGVWQKGQFIPYHKLHEVQSSDPSQADRPRRATHRIDGNVYSGSWVAGKLQGKGSCVYKSGDVYEGEFKDSKRHGFGVFSSPGGPDVYGIALRETEKADAQSDSKDADTHTGGTGRDTRARTPPRSRTHFRGQSHSRPQSRDEAEGYTYVGEWVNGYREGRGTATYRGGGTYDGQWKHNYRHGKGILKYPDGATLEGEFRENAIYDGTGRFAKKLASLPGYHLYEGTWRAGKLQGEGKCVYAMGEVYAGEWQDGQRHGQGSLTFPTGESVEGEFRADRVYTAKGSFRRRSGAVLRGQWVAGVFQGEEIPPVAVEDNGGDGGTGSGAGGNPNPNPNSKPG